MAANGDQGATVSYDPALGLMEAPNLGFQGGVMSEIGSSGSWNGRRYTPREKEQAVRMVRALREELGTSQGTVKRVAEQLGYGVESVRVWVKQADVDAGVTPGITSADRARVVALEQEVRELRRANSILRSSATFFAAELDRPLR
jgi:transposase